MLIVFYGFPYIIPCLVTEVGTARNKQDVLSVLCLGSYVTLLYQSKIKTIDVKDQD